MKKNSVLITGASSGIGKEIAVRLASEGYKVFAGVRSKTDKFNLEKISKNIIGVYLDVTKPDSIDKAYWFVLKKTDGLCAIINNAGVAIAGPMEFLPIDKLKEQFDINTFGAIAVAQKFLPMINEGKIINISSMSATGIFPFIAPYAASKNAMDILFNSLLLEFKNPRVKIVSIKPDVIRTPIWEKSIKSAESYNNYLPTAAMTKYQKEMNVLLKSAKKNDLNGLAPRKVSDLVVSVLKSKNPKLSYTVGFSAWLVVLFAKLPKRLVNFLVRLNLDKRLKAWD